MNSKFIIAASVVALAMIVLVRTATVSTAKAVVTVEELVGEERPLENIRLGARLTAAEIDYQIEPEMKLEFRVGDIATAIAGTVGSSIPVTYYGVMPDTLKAGRDVILEGDYDGERFVADSLLTQCPSKYEPPVAPKTE